ncbi:hypothetical protein EBR77_03215 [bacterium]|nr:hypothetical protein [bacterium]
MKKNMYSMLLYALIAPVCVRAQDADDEEKSFDVGYTSFYIDPLSGEGEGAVQNDNVPQGDNQLKNDLEDIIIAPKVPENDPQYFLEQALLETEDITESQNQNLPQFLIVREGIEAAQSYEQAGQAFLEKNDTAQAIEAYEKALQLYEEARSRAKERQEHRELKHAIRSANYILRELKSEKNKKVRNKKGAK